MVNGSVSLPLRINSLSKSTWKAKYCHTSDNWIDYDKSKVNYEIPFNHHFYMFELLRTGKTNVHGAVKQQSVQADVAT